MVLHCFSGCYFQCLTCVTAVQVQPLSLEELLAKKKAEEEAEAKVIIFLSFTFSFPFFKPKILFSLLLLFPLSFSAQVPLQGGARSWGFETEGATDRGKEEVIGRGEEEEKDVPGHGEKNDGCASASGSFSVKWPACCYRSIRVVIENVCYRGPTGEGETRAKRANGSREQREWRRWRATKAQRGER